MFVCLLVGRFEAQILHELPSSTISALACSVCTIHVTVLTRLRRHRRLGLLWYLSPTLAAASDYVAAHQWSLAYQALSALMPTPAWRNETVSKTFDGMSDFGSGLEIISSVQLGRVFRVSVAFSLGPGVLALMTLMTFVPAKGMPPKCGRQLRPCRGNAHTKVNIVTPRRPPAYHHEPASTGPRVVLF